MKYLWIYLRLKTILRRIRKKPQKRIPRRKPVDVSRLKDVHSFDGSINHREIPICSNRKEIIQKALSIEGLTEKAKSALSGITPERYDGVNKYFIADLLAFLIEGVKEEDLWELLNEQLEDIQDLGRCDQGYSIRLMNLIEAFHE
jgi:hypothetical protein